VRELKSTVDRLVLLFDGPILRDTWWEMPETRAMDSRSREPGPAAPETLSTSLGIPNQKQKLALAKKLLQESDDNYSWVAGQLGINATTLWR